MSTIFSKIVSGEIPSYKVAENDKYLAFLDINPLNEGHTLVIPKNPTDYIFDMEDEEYRGLWSFAKKVSHAVGKAIPCKRVGVAVIGLEVAHAHIHLVPINNVSDIDFSRPKLKFSEEEFSSTLEKIKSRL
ncbi:HIT family hydrolase, diadenosine tetraphosphate hydrolase [Owenweeksia hongkongensis DSM 17368]|uniref:HIT family hydrolase, diadenosine tetraphosphate hydrolase n=1 Tax=Owenweeksia hongkongensis (strain DSM 17368 / CIP 108786 / JCM 12287 / NRRL B-23963 / UST20020801) TaxID=926562 RepID=G8R0V0_OWEHD|nr:HIT family protein [Owenweeksia hongkongensis]AEV33827.1 HIT family hydrolase, diadenosine tetraphosphate hydrolase [Owenweeksia hongkongensis DSM 17368]